MELSIWSLCQIFAKLALYVGFAGAIAGPFIQILIPPTLANNQYAFKLRINLYSSGATLFGLSACAIAFFVQVANLSATGFKGMLDPLMLQLLWVSDAGTAFVLQLFGFSSLLLASICLKFAITPSNSLTHSVVSDSALSKRWLFIGISVVAYVFGLLTLATAFAVVGHVSLLTFWIKSLLLVHVLAIAYWIGSLWPLLIACSRLEILALTVLLERFSRIAMIFVAILIICGVVLAYVLVGGWHQLVTSAYGQVLMLKIIAVTGLLAFAAVNKWVFTRALMIEEDKDKNKNQVRLATSIKWEMLVGLAVLLITAVLTTIVGPHH